MSFENDIANVLTTDTSLNSLVDLTFSKRISPKTDESANSIMVYTFNKEESENSRSGMNYLQTWSLQIYVGAIKSRIVQSIGNRLQEYLENYRSDNISLIVFDSDNPEFDDEDDIHFNDLYFTVYYQG